VNGAVILPAWPRTPFDDTSAVPVNVVAIFPNISFALTRMLKGTWAI